MGLFNFFTCDGFQVFDDAVKAGVTRSCNLFWTLDVIVLFIIAYLPLILRKQAAEGVLAGLNFNHIFSWVGGAIGFLISTTLLGEPRWVLLISLAGIAAGGFGGGLFSSTTEDYQGGEGSYDSG